MEDMFVRKVKKSGGIISVRICESHRIKGKGIFQKNIKIVGQSKVPEQIAVLENAAKEMILSMQKKNPLHQKKADYRYKDIPESVKLKNVISIRRMNEGIFDIFGHIYDSVGLKELIEDTYKDGQWNDILKALVLGRIAGPESKRKTARVLSQDYSVNHPLEKYYRVMDRAIKFASKAQEIVLDETKRTHGGKIQVMLFDVTTLYFESVEQDDLRDFGFSKDNKFKEVQVVLSLMTTNKGEPVGYKLFPGNTSEGKTLLDHIEEVKERMGVDQVTLIADRAMFNRDNLKKMDELGMDYIVACKLRQLPKDMKKSILTDNIFQASLVNGDLHWIKDYEHESRRLIVSYSSKRARKNKRDRERLVERVLKKAKDGKVKAADAIGNKGNVKFLKVRGKTLEVDQGKVQEEAKWDGLHGVITNLRERSSPEILADYHQLWKIEYAFRLNKHDLRMRPVYHWKTRRVQAHVLICYLAYAVGHFTMDRLNKGRKEKLGESGSMSFGECVDVLSRVESVIVKNREGHDKNLYVVPISIRRIAAKYLYSIGGGTQRKAILPVAQRVILSVMGSNVETPEYP